MRKIKSNLMVLVGYPPPLPLPLDHRIWQQVRIQRMKEAPSPVGTVFNSTIDQQDSPPVIGVFSEPQGQGKSRTARTQNKDIKLCMRGGWKSDRC